MHFQAAFGLDALENIGQREYRRWMKYIETFGPIHWKRWDWLIAHNIDCIAGSRQTSAKTYLIQFRNVRHDPKRNLINSTIVLASAFGGTLPAEDIEEIREAALLYG